MSKIKIVLDSTSGIDLVQNKIDAEVLRLIVMFDGEEYVDGEDITPIEFYKLMDSKKEVLPSTSQPTIGRTVEQFERLRDEGYSDLICLTISGGLSGTYATTVSAKDMVEGVNVHIVDTLTTAAPLYLLAEAAFKMVNDGKTVTEIIDYVESIKSEYKIYLAVGDLTLLKKNGRLSTASALIGSVLKVKPVLRLDDSGVIESVEKVRTMRKAISRLVEIFTEQGDVSEVTLLHSNCLELAEQTKEMIVESNPKMADITIYPLSPVIGSHLGTGTIGITFRKGRK